ncbi:unnamed protein product [Tilletia laevis]|uniref:Uncharacterized protein n=2 Tax=Tilletia TaxID=13289 RepID=A0A177VH71_9BASI|nr:hypothetical protein CF336_g1633 [Tilletia laevis]KAE8203495.1 hypothetical protein CF328_g1621 [Tilletia controversa]KAE8264145.1 hypothetical protein A4X03_0g1154 [Tilletia caries]KAE8207603.1 hypothetical protein CF335_g1025 [Tilletia laevis]CAD6887214.1 unnamed protein product [Tilletia caries]
MERINSCTYVGYVQSTKDALLIFEAVRQNRLPKITRRLREEERMALIRSGAVFVFDELESGVKRWTDGLYWSPSRILNNFLVYRQIEKKASQNAEDTKSKNKEHVRFSASDGAPQVPEGPIAPSSGGPLQNSLPGSISGVNPPGTELSGGKENEAERSLVGSLTNSFPFIHNGLCKKTISFPIGNSHQHLISYYAIEDVLAGRLRTPSSLPEFNSMTISPPLLNRSNFRIPPQIEVDHDGIPRYRGEPVEAPQNTRRRSGPSGSGDEQSSMILRPDGRPMMGTSTSAMGRMSNTPYSPGSATGMTGPADDFRGHSQQQQQLQQQQPYPQQRYAHQPPPPFDFSTFDPAVANTGAMMNSSGGSGGIASNSDYVGNRRRVVSDAPSRLAQLRIGTGRYEPYPSSSSSSSFHSESGHSSGMAMSAGHSGSTDSHMSSPATRRELSNVMTTPGGGTGNANANGGVTPSDGRPQSARQYGENYQNGMATAPGWRADAGYLPVTPNAGSVNSSTTQSPRGDSNFAPPLPPVGSGPLNPTTVGAHDYSQQTRNSHEMPPYYPHLLQQTNNVQNSARMPARGGADWDGMFNNGVKGSGLGSGGGSGGDDSGQPNAGGVGQSNVTLQGVSVHPGSSAEHGRLQSSSGYMYVPSGGGLPRAAGGSGGGGAGGLGYDYSTNGQGNTSMSTPDRSLSADLAGSRPDHATAISANAPYYPNVASWSSNGSSEMGAEAMQVMHGQIPPPPQPTNSSLSSASSSQGNGSHNFRTPGPLDWRTAAHEAHQAHRSNSVGSDFSATGPVSSSGAHQLDWYRPGQSVYGSAGAMGSQGAGGALIGKSPLATTLRDGTSGGGLERVVLRRPPSNG